MCLSRSRSLSTPRYCVDFALLLFYRALRTRSGRIAAPLSFRYTVLLVAAVLALLVSASFAQLAYYQATPQDIYPGCFCFYEWNDANRVGNWTFEENWLQLQEPDAVAFTRISGDNTITLTSTRQVNQLTLGQNRWDTTRLVLQQDLIIGTPKHPRILWLSFPFSPLVIFLGASI